MNISVFYFSSLDTEKQSAINPLLVSSLFCPSLCHISRSILLYFLPPAKIEMNQGGWSGVVQQQLGQVL